MRKWWTDEEKKVLKELAQKGLTPEQISNHIPNRTDRACLGQLQRLGACGYHRQDRRRPSENKQFEDRTPSAPRKFSWQMGT